SLFNPNLLKIKIFDINGRIICSTDPKQIGKKFPKYEGFLKALSGENITKLNHKNLPKLLEIESNNSQHLLSSYVPIHQKNNNQYIPGVIEVYNDLTPLYKQIEQAQRDILIILILVFGLLYGALFIIVYQGDRILTRQMFARELAEEELEQKIKQLAQSNAELEQFAYVASHDLQEPLRKIEAFGDRLQSKYGAELGDKGKEYIDRMQNAAGRMRTLIQDLLEFSRISGKAQPFDSVNLKEVIEGVLDDLETGIEETGSSIEVGSLPIMDADPLQMRQLFQNLLGNALKFRQIDKPLKVIIQSQILKVSQKNGQPKSSATCQITIADNGIGFEQKYTDRIFKVFQRLHSKSEYAGTGIGLAVCAKIVERHGGSITAESVLGQGATFIITLPIQQNGQGHRQCRLAETPS
ncbi:MAG: ATP-binding protein, partial [Thermosynechococcaceae cyanobacterium]